MAKNFKTFKFDAGAVVALGRDSIKDNTTAIIELVKNSYDADADEVFIEISSNNGYIRVADNGTGMTNSDIDNNWLRIGFSEKSTKTISSKKRRKTGEKGIGRLCAYRLGHELNIKTKAKRAKLVALNVNWKDFEKKRVDAEKVKIKIIKSEKLFGEEVPIKSVCGTELKIIKLRQQWLHDDIEDLYRELENLIPPFDQAAPSFKIKLENDVVPDLNGYIERQKSKMPRIELKADYNDKSTLSFKIYEPKLVKKVVKKNLVDSGKISSKQLVAIDKNGFQWGQKAGAFSVILRFYPQVTDYVNLINISRTKLREYLDLNAGLKIYRDGVRVKPYGDPEHPDGDWLGLEKRKGQNPAGAGRESWNIANRQLVGGVFISRDTNVGLQDSSSREGLINGDEFHELKSIVSSCINILEAHYHKSFTKEKNKNKTPDSTSKAITDNVQVIEKEVADISQSVKRLVKDAPDLEDEILEIVEKSNSIRQSLKEATKDVEQLASQTTVYRGLATIGITTAVFGHETQSSIDQLLGSLHTAKLLLPKNDPVIVKEELLKAVESSNNISAWGKFALSRINRDKRRRRKINLNHTIGKMVTEMTPLMAASGIKVKYKPTDIEGVYFAMDIESIVMNLLSNAYFACKQKSSNRVVEITLSEKKIKGKLTPLFLVSDSGPGVPKKMMEEIFEPLYTTKKDTKGKPIGTGLGLSIVKSILDDMNGDIRVDKDPRLKGARFTVILG